MIPDPNFAEPQPPLTAVQKAAAILVAVGRDRASRLIKYFKGDELRRLIDAAHEIDAIPQTQLDHVVEEFEAEFSQGSGLLDSAETIDSIISQAFTPEEFSQLLNPANDDEVSDETVPIWTIMEGRDVEEIAEFVETENELTCALILSKLSSRKSADIIAAFERERRKQVLKHMLSLGAPTVRACNMVERVLRDRFSSDDADGVSDEGRIRVANVLNELDRPNMEEVFDDLANESDPNNIAAVKSLLFRFEDIVQLEQSARSIIFDGIEADAITTALRGAESDVSEAILGALGQRTRRMIESELAAEAPVKADAIADARRAIASTAIKLASEGRITLPAAQEEAA